jgi:hypothetical protein
MKKIDEWATILAVVVVNFLHRGGYFKMICFAAITSGMAFLSNTAISIGTPLKKEVPIPQKKQLKKISNGK